MNKEELIALVAQREKEGKNWVTLPLDDVKELLGQKEVKAVPWIGEVYGVP